jgi:hypothetical protein
VIEDVLVWNGRAADPAPSKREELVGTDEAPTKAADIWETLDERQPPARGCGRVRLRRERQAPEEEELVDALAGGG